MTEPENLRLTERAADDLLLLLARLETTSVPVPGPEDVASVLTAHTADVMPQLARRVRGNAMRGKDITAGFVLASEALGGAATGHLLLSLRLLAWAADRTGLTHAEVVAEVLARTDVEEGA